MLKVFSVHIHLGRGMDQCTRNSNAVSTEIQAACRRAAKSVCVVTSSRYTNPLRLSHRKTNPPVRDLVIVAAIDSHHYDRSNEPRIGAQKCT
ncbi:hypothetical protein TNCV_4339031 [Trichonephila clavipes]|nr:hypothetical protein TNCV_4339031 [Trichonephila clavipes]